MVRGVRCRRDSGIVVGAVAAVLLLLLLFADAMMHVLWFVSVDCGLV